MASTVSVHCPQTCPENPQGSTIVHRHIYALSNNPETKFANWVAYEVSPANYGNSSGRAWRSEPLLPRSETLEVSDYKGAYASELRSDKGHLAPVGAFAGSHHRYELDYLTNVVPQHQSLNRGPWGKLEDAIREAAGFDDPINIFTGPVYQKLMPELPSADEPHVVPSAFFKLAYNDTGGVAFIMPQTVTPGVSFCGYRVAITQVQKAISFKLPNIQESTSIAIRICGTSV